MVVDSLKSLSCLFLLIGGIIISSSFFPQILINITIYLGQVERQNGGGKTMSIIIRIATENDVPRIKQLLQRAKLNKEGIEKNYEMFLVVEENQSEKIVATAGIEQFGPSSEIGFLRSLVIESESWRSMIGLDLMIIIRQFAKQKGCKELYLLTNPVSRPFFEHLQFESIDYKEVPKEIRNSKHFKQTYQHDVLIMRGK